MRFYTNVTTSGKKILVREIDTSREKPAHSYKVDYQPSLYTPSQNLAAEHRSIFNLPLDQRVFDDPMAFWTFRKTFNGVEGMELYGDINPAIQFLSDEFKNNIEFDFNLIRTFYFDIEVYTHDGKFPTPDLAKYPISAIGLYDNITATYYVWGLEYAGCWKDAGKFDPKLRHADKNIVYRGFAEEEELLKAFLNWWSRNTPDILTGWNTTGFDIPYVINRIQNEYDKLKAARLSPWKKLRDRTIEHFGKPQQTYGIEGVADLDYLTQYKKHSFTPQEKYTLDHVAYAELGEGKMNYDEVSGLHELYRTDYQKYIDYNIKDANRVFELEEKRHILLMIVASAFRSRCNFEDIISPIRTWDALIYNYLKDQKVFCPPRAAHVKSEQYAGAYVKEPQTGRFDWVVSADLASLYPSLIRQCNISPETLIRGQHPEEIQICATATTDELIRGEADLSAVPQHDYSMAANGTFYRKDIQGFLPILLESLYLERKAEKKKMLESKNRVEEIKTNLGQPGYDETTLAAEKQNSLHWHTMQYSKKILLNSAYGALGNNYFRLYDIRLAEAITLTGQVAIQWVERKLNEYFNAELQTDMDYVIAIDTDSVYLNMGPLVKLLPDMPDLEIVEALHQFFEKYVAPVITAAYDELYEYLNNREQLMFMDREVIANMAIWSKKKRYLLSVYDNEGVRKAKPEVKITGYSMIKSDVPEIVRNKVRSLLPIIVDGTNDELIREIEIFRKQWKELDPSVIAKPTGVRGIAKYSDPKTICKKGTLAHIRAAIYYNRLHLKHDLGHTHNMIQDGDKMKWVFLSEPNPTGTDVIGFPDYLPKELELDDYIDRSRQFETRFLGPLKEVTEAIGWNTEKISNLNFFIQRELDKQKTA